MTEQAMVGQTSATAQLKQMLKDRVSGVVGVASKASGQQVGALAQAVRQAGEEMRQQGQEGQGRTADKVAQPIQKFSGTLSQVDPDQLNLDPKSVKSQVGQQFQQLKTQAGTQVSQQVSAQAGKAGQGVTAVLGGVRSTGQQLRAQGQEVPALILDALLEKVEPLGNSLTTMDAETLRGNAASFGRQVKTKLSSATATVDRKRQAASSKSVQLAKQTVQGVRRNPVLPAAGAVVGVLFAARRASKPKGQTLSTPAVPAAPGPSTAPVTAADLDNMSRSQLMDRAAAAGLAIDMNMTKGELRVMLEN